MNLNQFLCLFVATPGGDQGLLQDESSMCGVAHCGVWEMRWWGLGGGWDELIRIESVAHAYMHTNCILILLSCL